jgi:hypothetical protein
LLWGIELTEIRKSIVFLLLIFCIASLAACTKIDATDVNFSVSGEVVFDGKPLENVEILINNVSATPNIFSDSEGFFIVSGLEKGDVISFNLAGYGFQPYTVKNRDIEGLLAVAERLKFDVSVRCDTARGTVVGAGSYEFGESATLTATAMPMFKFDGYFDGETKLSEEAEYTFTVDQIRSFTAVFLPITYTLTISNVPDGVTVSGGGSYVYGDTVRLEANNTDNYVFEKWLVNNIEITNKIYEFAYSVADTTVSAVFLPRLQTPEIEYVDSVVAWSPVTGASGYTVYLDDVVWFETEDTFFSISEKVYELPSGTIGVVAKGVGDDGDSLHAEILVSYYRPIDTPSNVGILNLGDIYLSFMTVNTAVGYNVLVNGTAYPLNYFDHEATINEIKVNVGKIFTSGGTYSFRVVALASIPEKNSAPTTDVNYVYTPALPSPVAQINGGVLTWSHEYSNVEFYAVIDGVRISLNGKTDYDLTALSNGSHSVIVEAHLSGYVDSSVDLIYTK